MKPITGQYECVHSSGVGLDYFTSRIDHLTLQPDGRFVLIVQNRSRATHAAHSIINGQQNTIAAPETRSEGTYTCQDRNVSLHFEGGGLEEAMLAVNGEGLQVGPNFFSKVSDSTLLPPTHRLKQNMDDIAKGIKIATTLGGMAAKAANTIKGTIQTTQGTQTNAPSQPTPNVQATHVPPPQTPAANQAVPNPVPQQNQAIFCDQCGARCRPDKRFCNNCGATLLA